LHGCVCIGLGREFQTGHEENLGQDGMFVSENQHGPIPAVSNPVLVGGYACSYYRFAAAGGAVGREAGVANLVEQGAIADG
jgi:hypothetical protein